MRPDDGEVLDALGRGGVRNVDDDAQIVANRPDATLERARQRALRKLELERELVVAAGHDGYGALLVFV